MRDNTGENKVQEKIERLKADFCGTAMEGTDVDWLLKFPLYKDDLHTDVEEIRKQTEDKEKEIR